MHLSRMCPASWAAGGLVPTAAWLLRTVSANPIPDGPQDNAVDAFKWAVIGDSWASGVSYNSSNAYDNANCFRTTEAWGVQMKNDKSWLGSGEQVFDFAACGGSLMGAMKGQMQTVDSPSVVWGTFGGNNVFFGDIARACIYQPLPGGWGKYWDEDPEGEGYCKRNIKKAEDYMSDDLAGFRTEFTQTLDAILAIAQDDKHTREQFDLYVSSYVSFFNQDTDACDNWSFGHSWVSTGHPKLVKGLRKVMNEKTAQLNNLQADIINKYQIPEPKRPNYRIHNAQPSDLYIGHRFCEPGHTFEDQYYHPDVWIWNLQYQDTKSAGAEVAKTEDGVTFMSGSGQRPDSGTVLAAFASVNDAEPADAPKADPRSQHSFGWTSRPFHPKWSGHEAMKNFFVRKMKDDGIPGVKGSKHEPPPPPEEQVTCNGLGSGKYVGRDGMRDIIEKEFCPAAVAQGGLDENSESITRKYQQETVEEVTVSISYKRGLDFKPNSDDCVRLLLGRLIDGCDGNDPKNPMNWKGGGRVVRGDVTYDVTPTARRQPAEKAKGGGCDSSYKFLFNSYVVWGNGWASADSGRELKQQVKGCALLPDTWSFNYGLGSDGREWTAEFRTGVFQKHCVGRAIKGAGGPEGCNGSG